MATRAHDTAGTAARGELRRISSLAALGAALVLVASLATRSSSNSGPTTTTTTIPEPPFSVDTQACVKHLASDQKICKFSAPASTCQADYDAAFPDCFAPGKGVSCATSCVTKKASCLAGVTIDPKCPKACQNVYINAGGQCAGDTGCVAAARADYDACKLGCANPSAAVKCRNSFYGCIVKCPNIGPVPTTTTLPLPSTTTTTLDPLATTTTSTTKPPKTTTTTSSTTSTTKPAKTTTSTTLKPSTTTTTSTLKPPKSTTTTTLKPVKTTTTTVPTTTTTLPPLPPFSDKTSACVAQAAAAQAACTGSATVCQAQYDVAFLACFAPGAGVTCAATCENVDTLCQTPLTAKSSCASTCQNTWVNAGTRCQGDAGCAAATLAAYTDCKNGCTHPPTLLSCRTAFVACVASCPNL
jgi:hypothetical protein